MSPERTALRKDRMVHAILESQLLAERQGRDGDVVISA